MRLHILSDLHLEIAPYTPQQIACDAIILAGDIANSTNGIEWARRAWPSHQIIFVPGNHEYFKLDRAETLVKMRGAAQSLGIHLLDNNEVVIDGVRFLGATLWADFNLFGEGSRQAAMRAAQSFLPDFQSIEENGKIFTPARSAKLHEASVAWLSAKLKEYHAGKTVVVTHHLPAMQSVADRFKTSMLSASFASYRNELIGHSAWWIHGHSHDSADYVLNGTRVVCNPKGYSRAGSSPENKEFDPKLVLQI